MKSNTVYLTAALLLTVFAVFLIIYGICFAKCYRIELGWDRNTEEDLAGYKMYQGDVSGDPSHIALPNIPADANDCIVDANVPIGKSIFFAATAFDTDNNESGYSNFVEFIAENQSPVAKAYATVTDENVPVRFILEAEDPDGDKLVFSIFSQPLHGTITGELPEVIYTPNKDYSGADNFIFRATDGYAISNDATIAIAINAVPPKKPTKLKINRCLPII